MTLCYIMLHTDTPPTLFTHIILPTLYYPHYATYTEKNQKIFREIFLQPVRASVFNSTNFCQALLCCTSAKAKTFALLCDVTTDVLFCKLCLKLNIAFNSSWSTQDCSARNCFYVMEMFIWNI